MKKMKKDYIGIVLKSACGIFIVVITLLRIIQKIIDKSTYSSHTKFHFVCHTVILNLEKLLRFC